MKADAVRGRGRNSLRPPRRIVALRCSDVTVTNHHGETAHWRDAGHPKQKCRKQPHAQ